MPLYLMPLFPLIGFALLITLGGRVFKGTAGGWLASFAVLASFVVALSNFLSLDAPVREVLWEWLPGVGGEGKNLAAGLYLDQVSSIMTLVITGVGFLIHVFSIGYMQEDPKFTRYFAFLNFFVALMLILVLGDSYPLMFVGWEGVGMASYLLIGFWFNNKDYADAARKAFIMNRIGDLGFMLGMFLLYNAYGTLYIPELAQMEGAQVATSVVNLICIFLLIGAAGKSAQLPLTTWLPDAMAGPTPVSALIHAATMVTAGVYLISRTHFLFEQAHLASQWVAWVGALTALYGALSALNQYDIKKILAFSTVSQIGYMILAVGVGAYWAGMFHLVTHAFFKALLFLSAGSVIHGCHHEQDVRHMGGLAKKMPTTHAVSLIGVLAIAGVPFLSGFFSKDAILASAYEHNLILYIIGIFVALLTAFYMGRWYFLVFRGTYRGHAHPHESPPIMTIPLVILAALSVLGGYMGLPAVLGHNVLAEYLSPVLGKVEHHLSHSTEWVLIAIATAAGLIGLWYAFMRYKNNTLLRVGSFEQTSLKALHLDAIYDGAVGLPSKAAAAGLDALDRGLDSGMAEAASVVSEPGGWITRLQTGLVRSYAALMLVGTAGLLFYWGLQVLGGAK